jgi:hypothetical protein
MLYRVGNVYTSHFKRARRKLYVNMARLGLNLEEIEKGGC